MQMPASELRECASGLQFPEGPVALGDGSLLVVEMARGTLTRIHGGGKLQVIAHLGGGPNGAALGPDGRCVVCNNGGAVFRRFDGHLVPGFPPPGYSSGWIDSVNLSTGKSQRLYDRCDGIPLKAPNDIVFDSHGGFWFTDLGKDHQAARTRDRGAVYYAKADGSRISEAIFPLEGPNGIGLSPDEKTLYVAESNSGRLWAFDLAGPGKLASSPTRPTWQRGRMLWASPCFAMLDSLCLDAEGNIYVASVPAGTIEIISPTGKWLGQIVTPDPVVTNPCFGGVDFRTLFITLSSTGRVVATECNRAGLHLPWSQTSRTD
ncbi:SMP-30/gluconolactonase/LRE family protein [Ferrovibrio sp.]|uniref:SMP-30/gluconolactonase/LRE family protein n=1 Tax=Ferrovibrio sp. TaxID=1917215 RepID=UPI003D11AB7C